MRYLLCLSVLVACGCAEPGDSARLSTLTSRISGLSETVASADDRIKENTRALNYLRDQVEGLPDNGVEYQTTSLQTDELTLEYFEAKFAALEAKVESAACTCNEQAVSSSEPELFEPPVIPSVTDRVVSSRLVSVGDPVVTYSQPVSYSNPVTYSSTYSSPVSYSSGFTSDGMVMQCNGGTCSMVQRPSGFTRKRIRIRR